MKRQHIEVNPKILLGKPVIKGTRMPVYLIMDLLSVGYTIPRIIKEYPELTQTDIKAAIRYAGNFMRTERLHILR